MVQNAGSTSFSVTSAAPIAQSITGFAPASPITYSASGTFALSATGGASGNPVTFGTTTPSICSVSGSTATVLAAGTCTLTANQAGNGSYSAAPQVTANVVINKANQTISFATPPARTFGDAPFVASATATSGLGVTFTSTTLGVCTVSSGSTVTLIAAGACTLAADQGGNGNYNPAPQVSQSFAVNKANQTISFAALANKSLGDAAFTVSATASSSLGVTFSSATTGVCAVSGSTVTLVATGTCTINANQGGNTNYNAALQVAQSFTVGSTPYGGYHDSADCTAISGWAWASNQPNTVINVDIYDGSTLLATVPAGNFRQDLLNGGIGNGYHGFYLTTPASVMNGQSHSITVKYAGTQTNLGTTPRSLACIGANDPVQAGNAGRYVSQSVPTTMVTGQTYPVTVTMKNIGTTTWASATSHSLGSQNPRDNWNWGLGRVATPGSVATSGTATYTFNVTAPAPGSYNFQWQMVQDGVAWFGDFSPNVAITVTKANQTITFPPIQNRGLGSASFVLTASASSGLPISYTSTTGSSCTVSGSTVALVGMGTCTIVASQLGNDSYNPAAQLSQSFNVYPGVVTSVPPAFSGSSPTPAGKLDGKLAVSAAGAATYSIPIKVPPGTAGMSPAISLDYNSLGSNGLMGMGWAINGLSSIERCARNFAQDSVPPTAVDMSANDRFCMAGQRLIAISGTYGAAGSEYRTEIESFSKIVAVGQTGIGPTSFIVTSRSGLIMEFGSTTDSRIIPSGQSTALVWALNKVRDPRGNYYTVSYANDTANNQYYPIRIDYTGFTPVTTGSPSAPYNSIQFIYDQSRTDAETGYMTGSKYRITARLRNVQTFAGSALVRDYRVSYDSSLPTGRSRVVSVKECAGDGTCLSPTTFGWNDDAINFSGAVATLANDDAAMLAAYGGALAVLWEQHFFVDVNGDGRPDLCATYQAPADGDPSGYSVPSLVYMYCALTQPAGAPSLVVNVGFYNAAQASSELHFADVNGDGITDICGLWPVVSPPTTLQCALMGATGVTSFVSEPYVNPTNGYFKRWVADVNGDGRADICTLSFVGSYINQTLACSLSTGTGFAPPVTLGNYNFNCYQDASYNMTCGPLQFDWADVTGDGILSYCIADSTTTTCRKWTTTGLAAPVTGAYSATTLGRTWVDVNGDGKADFCRMSLTTAPQGNIICSFATGTGLGDTISATVADLGTNQQWVDVNGDGKADFCRVLATNDGADHYVDCLLTTTSGFSGSISSPIGIVGFPSIVDATGDGHVDVCYDDPQPSGAATNAKCLTYSGSIPDQLKNVADGYGANTSVSYKPISDPSVYTKGSGSTYPTIEIQNTSQVVSAVQTSDGIGGVNQIAYSYSGSRADSQGRGSLGFASISSYEPSNVLRKTDYLQNYPYTGAAARSQIINSVGGTVLSDSILSYGATSLGGIRYFVFPTLTVNKINDLNGAFINWAEQSASNYDAYGNPQLVSTVFKDSAGNADGFSQSTATTFSYDIANWILGQPINVQQTNATPGGVSKTRTTAMSYLPNGLLQQTIVEPNNGGLAGVTNLRRVTDFTYDVYGNQLTRTVSGANIATRTESTRTYDSRGQFIASVKNALNQQETRTYDPRFGTQLSATGPNGLTTTSAYDVFGRQSTETRADQTVTTTEYFQCVSCVPGSVYSVGTSNKTGAGATASPPSRTYYDMFGRQLLSRQTGFDGNEVYQETIYDNLGRVAYASQNYFANSSPIPWNQSSYDDLGRPTVSLAPDGGQTSFTYNGRTTSSVTPKGQKHTTQKNSQGRTISVVNADGSADSSRVDYTYEPFGNIATTTDSMGNITSITYDLLGRKTALNDPDLGNLTYTYDNLGQLLTQTNAKGQVATMTYDLIGRLTQRTEADLVSNWYYETNQSGVPCNKGIGKLCEAKASNGYDRLVSYDNLGRPASSTTTIDTAYTSSWTYDVAGRLDTTTYPQTIAGATLVVKNIYNANGYLSQIKNNNTGASFWQQNSKNADGNILSETYGNGVVATSGYDPLTGRLISIAAGANNVVQNQTYHYDSVGNLDTRADTIIGTNETFSHDNLNRLVTANLSGPGVTGVATTTVAYNAIGNITSKTSTLAGYNLGTYNYPASGPSSIGPHAVASVSGIVNGVANPAYAYDANGNLQSAYGKSITWTSFDMPNSIARGTGASSFLYSPEHQRVKQMWPNPNTPTNVTVYLFDPQYEKEINGSLTEHKHYILAGSRIVALYTKRSDGTEDTKYFHADHLGSTSVVTDSAGSVLERMAYDPWGDRRASTTTTAGAPDSTNAIIPTTTDRGYTGHEHLDLGGMGLIHMNGRIYDPTLGRFLSPDPYIQSPYHSQSYNRYSYVWNNPLTMTDPSGYETYLNPSSPEGLQQQSNPPQAIAGIIVTPGIAPDQWVVTSYDSLMRVFKAEGTINFPWPQNGGAQALKNLAVKAANLVKYSGKILASNVGLGITLLTYSDGIAVGNGETTSIGVFTHIDEYGRTVDDDGNIYAVSSNNNGGANKAARAGAALGASTGSPSAGPPPEGDDDKDKVDDRKGKTIQKGGRTISNDASNQLNQTSGQNLNRREWGRALEELKKENGLRGDDHGTLKADGSWFDSRGVYRGNVIDYIK